jgi:hypothetical protein
LHQPSKAKNLKALKDKNKFIFYFVGWTKDILKEIQDKLEK